MTILQDGQASVKIGSHALICVHCGQTGTGVELVTMHGDRYLPEYQRPQCRDWRGCMTRRRLNEAKARRTYCRCCGDDFEDGIVRIVVIAGQPHHLSHQMCGPDCRSRRTPLADRLANRRVPGGSAA